MQSVSCSRTGVRTLGVHRDSDSCVCASCRPKRERVAAKFVENEFEKCDRLMELFYTYQQALQRAMTRLLETGEDDPSVIDLTLRTSGKFIVEQVRPLSHPVSSLSDYRESTL